MEDNYTLKIIAGLSKRNADLSKEIKRLNDYIKDLEETLNNQ